MSPRDSILRGKPNSLSKQGLGEAEERCAQSERWWSVSSAGLSPALASVKWPK